MAQASVHRGPSALALRASAATVAALPATGLRLVVLRRLEAIALELIGLGLIGLIGRLPVGDWRMTEAHRP